MEDVVRKVVGGCHAVIGRGIERVGCSNTATAPRPRTGQAGAYPEGCTDSGLTVSETIGRCSRARSERFERKRRVAELCFLTSNHHLENSFLLFVSSFSSLQSSQI